MRRGGRLVRSASRAVLLAGALTVAATLAVAVNALAGQPASDVSRADDGSVLHRKLPPVQGEAERTNEFIYDPVVGGSLPSEMRIEGEVLRAPEAGLEPEPGEAVYSPHGLNDTDASSTTPPAEAPPGETPGEAPAEAPGEAPPGEGFDPRATIGDFAKPDRRTQKESRLDYHATFDPSIVPFKRNRALNAVSSGYELRLARGHLRRLEPLGNRIEAGREVFWGSVLVEGRAGEDVALPSVSPQSRILSYEVAPDVPLAFFQDEADNFYVRLSTAGRFRLVFVMDAPTSYFGRPVPAAARVSDVPRRLLPPLPAQVKETALSFAGQDLGLTPASSYRDIVHKLTAYFRSFEPGDPPPPTEDVYLDLCRARKGVCRHRAFTFVITSLALGVPARYVFNEAHVFVEVWIPGDDPGWLRVDLGGGADQLFVHNADDKIRHRPRPRDPFEKPPEYADQAIDGPTAGATEVLGLPPDTREVEQPPGTAATAKTHSRATGLVDKGNFERPAATPGSRTTATSLQVDSSIVFRGERLTFSGQVVDAEAQPVRDGTVQLLLLAEANDRCGTDTEEDCRQVKGKWFTPVRRLGAAGLDSNGLYVLELTFPEDQPPGSYEIVAEFTGSGGMAPSTSD